jgi:hypothetical protein
MFRLLKRTLLASVLVVSALVTYQALAGGSVTVTHSKTRQIAKTTCAWSITTNANLSATVSKVSGELLRVVVLAQGHTNTYDILLNDAESVDLLQGSGADCSNAVTHLHADYGDTVLPIATDGDLTLVITNYAGLANNASTNGTVVLYHR